MFYQHVDVDIYLVHTYRMNSHVHWLLNSFDFSSLGRTKSRIHSEYRIKIHRGNAIGVFNKFVLINNNHRKEYFK